MFLLLRASNDVCVFHLCLFDCHFVLYSLQERQLVVDSFLSQDVNMPTRFLGCVSESELCDLQLRVRSLALARKRMR